MARTMLVVEDEIELLLILVEAARERGFDATGTIDPHTVLARVRAVPPPDVVLLDLRMPRLDGRDLLLRMCEIPTPPTVIVITGWIDEYVEATCRAYGAADLVRKPFELDDLFRRIETALAPS